MVWRIFGLLAECRADPRFRAIAHYLEGDDFLKRIQLADRLGDLFDQYLVYRPDWLIAWERDETATDWQAILWRRLVEGAGGEFHLAHAWTKLRAMRHVPEAEAARLPSRLCVFGISSLPPLFLQVLRAYASAGELHLFLLQPTGQYWGDLVSKKRQAKMARGGETEPCYLEEGHPLVASLGKQGQDLLNLLIDGDFQQSEERELFREAEGGSLLARLQNDILHLIDRQADGSDRIEVGPEEASIQVHSCHSPMREIEVLHDQLLDLFQKDPTLRPRDVLVMIPEIETYAPYIQAVFGTGEGPGSRIPFSVVDRRPRSAYHAIDVWFRLLELAGSRFGARDVVSLLETPPFRARFGLGDRDVNTLRSWIQVTGIRWGIDAAHREQQSLPGIAETTWQSGIDQWLLGYSMREYAEGEASSFEGIFPYDEIEGGNIQLFDRFLKVLDFLFRARAELEKPRSLAAWRQTLSMLLEELFGGVEEAAREADVMRGALAAMKQTATVSHLEEDLPLEVIRYVLEKTMDDKASQGGFLSGGVTFCTLQPMRTIPARVVCLAGMNDDAFPRRPQQLGFDRMRDDRRVGDRSPREDDRYLFLETLLSVRETLLVSYVGQSARDLSAVPPSVLVSELLDHLDRVGVFPSGQSARQFLTRTHRLQPFHPDYFGAGHLFSYSGENATACQRLMGEQGPLPPFVLKNLAEPEEEWRTVAVGQLIRFFRNPAEYFVKERLGLRLPSEEPPLEDSEIFAVNSLGKYMIKKEAVDGFLEKRQPHEWERMQARGQAPLGNPGVAACQTIQSDARKFVARLATVIDPSASKTNRSFDRRLGEFHLRGELGPFYGNDLVISRPAKIKAKDRIAAWIQHLAACWSATGASMPRTILVGEDDVLTLEPWEDSEVLLEPLLQLYWRGLRAPLPFFPEAAWTFWETWQTKRNATRESALAAARKKFNDPDDRVRSEIEDPFVSICWERQSEEEAIGEDFAEIAETLFGKAEWWDQGGNTT